MSRMTERTLDVSDPKALRALAHPVRLRLLQLVREEQPVTNAELAARTGESTANVSYHMSVLARHGFVEAADAPGATRRHKPWRTTYDRMRMHSSTPGSTPLESAGGAVLGSLLAGARAEQDAYLTGPTTPQDDVTDAAVFQLTHLVLTAEQAEELAAGYAALLDRYRSERDPGPGEARFSVTFVAVPTQTKEAGL
jgi:DNA-binding transcriptional ArsR family regulator